MRVMFVNFRILFVLWLAVGGMYSSALASQSTSQNKKSFQVDGQSMTAVFRGAHIKVGVFPKNGEGYYQLALRVLQDGESHFKKIQRLNRRRPLMKGIPVYVPFELLKPDVKSAAIQAVFPDDSMTEKGWRHRVRYSGESLGFIAKVFMKSEIGLSQLAKANKLKKGGRVIHVGDVIHIPWDWIRSDLELKPVRLKAPLKIKRDHKGERYAYYTLKRGEAIYSAIVVRFTGRILVDEVTRLSEELLSLNKIRDPKKIAHGTEIKIPIQWISDEYIETKSAKKPKKVRTRKAPESYVRRRSSKKQKSSKIHVILDAGHGGNDPGAVAGSHKHGGVVYEDEVVYDIMLRAKALLEERGYVVHPTIEDANQKSPQHTLGPRKDVDEYLLVHPHYTLGDVKLGVNLRVYLINDIYDNLVRKKGVAKENVVLMSIHADALHSSLRGMMVYYPDASLRADSFKLNGRAYRIRKEFRRKIHFNDKDNRIAEELSSEFAETMIDVFKDQRILMHKSSPVRSYHYRKGKKTLPAVLRYSKVPTSILVEVVNLNNVYDRRNVQRSSHRQKLANAIAISVERHYKGQKAIQVANR